MFLPLPCGPSHLTFSNTFGEGEGRREDTSPRKAPGMTLCVCTAWGLSSTWGSLHFAPSAQTPCPWMWRHSLPAEPPNSQLSSPSWDDLCLSQALQHPGVHTSSQSSLCASTPRTDSGHRHHSALMQNSMLIHLENT